MNNFTLIKRTFQTFFLIIILFSIPAHAQKFMYNDSWGNAGFTVEEQRNDGLVINYSIQQFELQDLELDGKTMKTIALPGHFLPNDEGAPDLPGSGRYIAIPQNAKVNVEVISSRKEILQGVEIAPAFRIPKDSENEPLEYKKNERIYSRDAFYPANVLKVSEPTQIRGLDVCLLGITPYQYNPVTKELVIYRDIKVQLQFENGSNQFGDNRLRSRWWDPLLKDAVLNADAIADIDYSKIKSNSRATGAEYVIVVPNDPDFIYWADSLKRFRIRQGISTKVVTIDEIGGNNYNTIESWVNDAYNSWDIPPAAILLVGDYGTSGNTIVSPVWDNYCASDHIYADVNNNDMADIVFARITARDADELQIMFGKIFSYETDPPTDPGFYNHPITALGWQTERWFQICSEVVGGYFKNVHGKDPVRINAIYQGNPASDPWSSNQNTSMVTNYFGPNGLSYIPATPQELGGWSGGTASDVNNAINDGAFILQHRDHGYEHGWGEPDYSSSDISGLDNDDLVFVFSINCLTGKYNMSGESFTEIFHRNQKGALGLIAASETSYSFVNDTYVWGMFDNMWPDFMPDNNTNPEPRGMYPSFGNVAGKYFLQQSNWPYNSNSKEVTYHLFHHHGGAFSTLYSEVPQNLTVVHDEVLLSGLNTFTVTADEGSLIALTVGEEIIGIAEGTGGPVDVEITPQQPPAMVTITITKPNYYRYSATLQVIPPDGPYVVRDNYSFMDENGNGQVDNGETIDLTLSMKNVGNENAENVEITLSTEDPYASLIDDNENYGQIASQQIVTKENAFVIEFADNIRDKHEVTFDITATDGTETWESTIMLRGHAPMLQYIDFAINDENGNNDNKVDPGESVELIATIKNTGSGSAYQVNGEITTSNPFVVIDGSAAYSAEIPAGIAVQQSFSITADEMTPPGNQAVVTAGFTAETGHSATGDMIFNIGQIPVLVLDLDQNTNSGSLLKSLLDDMLITNSYETAVDADVLNNYKSIFVSLGVYSDNHVLSNTEGSALKNYLDNGGNIYMEGGDTWYYDDPTPVHSYFHISSSNDGDGDMSHLIGQTGTFTEGMSFDYDGDNNWMDHLTAGTGADLIYKNQSPSYGAAVAYDAGDYRTIGASFEFGGLQDGQFTKQQLLEKYLEFFGFGQRPPLPMTPQGEVTVCNSETPVYSTNAVEYADYYHWMLSPVEAGEITGVDTSISIEWNPAFAGTAELRVCGMGLMGQGEISEALQINVTTAPSAFMEGDFEICRGDSLELQVELTGTAPWQLMLGDSSIVTAETSPYKSFVKPDSSRAYAILKVNDQSGCENQGEGQSFITVISPDAFTLGPDTTVCFYDNLEISVPADYAAYLWSDGSTGNSVIVDSSGVGMEGIKEVWLTVTDNNGCSATEYRNVEFTSCAGINEHSSKDLQIFPNPSAGSFNIVMNHETEEIFSIRVVDIYGKIVHFEKNVNLSPEGKFVDLSKCNNGVYFMIIKSENKSVSNKIIINK